MKSILVAATIAASALTMPALAATETAPQAAASATFSVQATPIAAIVKNAAAKAVLDKELPGLRFFYGRIGDMTVAQLAERSHGKVDAAKLQSIQAGFDRIR